MTAIFVLGQLGGFFLSAAGQLWITIPVAALLWKGLTRTGRESRWRAVLSPFAVPTLLIVIGGALHVLWWVGLVDTWELALIGALWAAFFFPLLCRIERLFDRSSARVGTLHRALLILGSRIGVGPSVATWISGFNQTALSRAP